MFQAVLPGCILINFFIYDPLLYFLKKLAGAKNLLDLHALGRGSNVRYTQECTKMKRSQSPQSGQTPTRVVLGSWPPLWVISEPGSAPAHGSLLGLPAATTASGLLGGVSGAPGRRGWAQALGWPRLDSAFAGEEACSPGGAGWGASPALLSFPSYPQWRLNSTSLSLPHCLLAAHLGPMLCSVWVSREGSWPR